MSDGRAEIRAECGLEQRCGPTRGAPRTSVDPVLNLLLGELRCGTVVQEVGFCSLQDPRVLEDATKWDTSDVKCIFFENERILH